MAGQKKRGNGREAKERDPVNRQPASYCCPHEGRTIKEREHAAIYCRTCADMFRDDERPHSKNSIAQDINNTLRFRFLGRR